MHLANWNKIEFIFAHKLGISPLELDEMEYYRIYYLLKEYEEYVDKENKEYERQQKLSETQYNGPKSTFNTPKFEIPKFNIPKL